MQYIFIFLSACVLLYSLVMFSSKMENKIEPNCWRKQDYLIGFSIVGSAILGIIIIFSLVKAICFIYKIF